MNDDVKLPFVWIVEGDDIWTIRFQGSDHVFPSRAAAIEFCDRGGLNYQTCWKAKPHDRL